MLLLSFGYGEDSLREPLNKCRIPSLLYLIDSVISVIPNSLIFHPFTESLMLISCLEPRHFCFPLVQTAASKSIFLTLATWATSRGLTSPFFPPKLTPPHTGPSLPPHEALSPISSTRHVSPASPLGQLPRFYSLSRLASFKSHSLQKACLKNRQN